MNVGAIGAIGSGTASVYAILSPYLNGVVRTSSAAAAAQLQASAAAASTAATQAVTPNALLGASSPPQPSPANQVLFGDGGTLIQSYGAVALVAGSQPLASVFAQPLTPLVAPAAPVTSVQRASKIA